MIFQIFHFTGAEETANINKEFTFKPLNQHMFEEDGNK